MAKKFYTPINMNLNEIQNLVLQKLPADPDAGSVTKGFLYYNTTTDRVRKFNGTKFDDSGDTLTFANIGLGIGLFAQRSSDEVQFKSLKAGSGKITITSTATEITIDVGTIGISNITNLQTALDAKGNLVSTPTNGHILTTDGTGQAIDSGKAFNDSGATAFDVWSAVKVQTAINNATAGLASSIHVPVADLTGAKALTDYADKMMLNIETLGLYRFDTESSAAADDNFVIRPTNIGAGSPGRWVKMSSSINDHNNLGNMQGGQTGEYYHLNAAQYAAAIRNATAGQSGLLAATDFGKFVAKTDKRCFTIGDGANLTYNINHGLNSDDVIVQIYEVATKARVETDITGIDANNVQIAFATAPISNQFRVVVIG